jgi:ATP-dependent helicase/nuclease subunit B
LRRWQNPQPVFGAKQIIPVGAFYVNLRGAFEGGDTRAVVLNDLEAKKTAYRHSGRFMSDILRQLDHRLDIKRGDQFNFALNKDGRISSKSREGLERKDFNRLLDQIEEQLRSLGKQIFSGVAAVDPYRKGRQTPCEYCDYRAICRIDDWTHEWRMLRAAETNGDT